jgi:hypothetical protein
MRHHRCILLLAMASLVPAQVAVVPSALAGQPLDQTRVRDLFLGRATTWQDGTPVRIVLVQDGDQQLLPVVGRDHQRLLRGWKRLVYSGNGAMPMIVPDARTALDLVRRTPGAIALLPTPVEDSLVHCQPIELGSG